MPTASQVNGGPLGGLRAMPEAGKIGFIGITTEEPWTVVTYSSPAIEENPERSRIWGVCSAGRPVTFGSPDPEVPLEWR